MADTMTRADALRALIERVEAGEAPHPMPLMWTLAAASGAGMDAADVARAFDGSLDAVARLEAPLRERGWRRDVIDAGRTTRVTFEWVSEPFYNVEPESVVAPTEPRARLLAVLRALLHEEASNGGS